MPKVNGYQVCRELKGNAAIAPIKVVMVTGLVEESDWHRALEAGADDYLTKPFYPRSLLEKVEQLLGPA